MSTCGLSAGAQQAYDRLNVFLSKNPRAFTLSSTGCIGMCYCEPLVEVRDNGSRVIQRQHQKDMKSLKYYGPIY